MVQNQEGQWLTIGGLAASAGVGVETVRFYQRRGLLETPARYGGIRRYGPRDVRRLRFIRKGQDAGFTLKEIKELLTLDAGSDRARALQLASNRIVALEKKIAELESARKSLQRLAKACGGGKAGPCPILSSFEI